MALHPLNALHPLDAINLLDALHCLQGAPYVLGQTNQRFSALVRRGGVKLFSQFLFRVKML